MSLPLFFLTPNEPELRIDDVTDPHDLTKTTYGSLWCVNWFVGVHTTGPAGFYNVATSVTMPFGQNQLIISPKYMIPYVEETLSTLYQKDRLLLVAAKDYVDTDPIDQWQKESVVYAYFQVPTALSQGKQLLITFDVEAYRPNKIQLFNYYTRKQTLDVAGRCKRAILIDIPAGIIEFIVFLRPVSKELYIYSVQADLI